MKFFNLFVFFLASTVYSFAQEPTITAFPTGSAAVAPFSGATGTTMTINGTNFTGATAVSFGGTPASSFTVVSSTQITAVVAGGSSGNVVVTTPNGTATRTGFTYLPLSRIVTDFGGYWSSTTASANATTPDDSHNLLGYNYNGTFYSTGVNDALLTTKGVSFTAGNYRALPVAGITGSFPASNSIYLTTGLKVDGNASVATVSGVSTYTIAKSLIDGTRGLDLGTGVTNLPATAVMNFNIYSIDASKLSDAEPDIIITQIADPSAGNDVFSFVNASGVTIGNAVTQDMTALTSFGNYKIDLFSFTANTPYNTALPTGTAATGTGTRGIRLVAFKLSDFGITAANVASIKSLKITPSGNSDYAFISYNANSINIPPNISQNDATTTSTVCTNGTAVLSVIGTAATGGTLSYLWEQSVDGGTSWTAVSNGGNFSGAATTSLSITKPVNSYKYRATVTESTNNYTNTSSNFTLTVSPLSVGGTIADSSTVCIGTNSTTLTLSGYTGSIVRWELSTNNFVTVTTIANTTATLTVTNLTATTKYRAVVQSGPCSIANSASATVTVNAVSAGGSITGSATACSGSNSTTLNLSGYTGSILKWQSSTDNFSSVITDIANTTATLTATNLTATTTYRAIVQSGNCSAATSSTATVTVLTGEWIGGTSGDWNNPANWCGGVPTLTTKVSIPVNSTVHIQSNIGVANSVTIASGASIIMTGDFKLRIADGGTFTNNGTFDASGSTGAVTFLGSGTITGSTTFQNIETFGALDFGPSSTIAGEFTLQPGGSVTGNSPTYLCPGSTLTYNTTGTYARSLEWPSVSSGKGLPSNVKVTNNTLINFPVAGAGYICNDLTIENGSALYQNFSGTSAPLTVGRNVNITGTLSLGNSPGDDITLGGNWTRSAGGVFSHNGLTVTFNSSNNSTITAPASAARDANGAFGGETFYNVNINKTSVSNSVSLASNVSVVNELKITKGIFNLSNNDVTVVSNATTTAHVATIPASGATVNYSGTGKFIIQRHLLIGTGSESRRWRLLTAPLQSSGAPNINNAWQEGVSNSNRNTPIDPWPGFGTTITKSTTYNAADGYDQGSTNNPSMYYHAGGASWLPVASTKAGAITDKEGYILFARGNRSIVVSTPTINASPTILEPKGRINIGNVQKNLTSGLQVMGNPYASAIDFGKATFNNYTFGGSTINNTTAASIAGITYYVFDPKTSGTSQVGKFITCSSNGDGTFEVTSNSSGLPTDGTIQSGSAIMINADNTGGTLTFHEADKIISSSTKGMASRDFGVISKLTTNLYAGTQANAQLADGVINAYNADYSNEVTYQDASKINNFNSKEELSISRESKLLAIERRNVIAANDTIFLNISNMSKITYGFQFIGKDLDPSLTAILEDKFTGVAKTINTTDTTYIPFEITNDAASAASDRFRIVFKPGATLAISNKSVKATRQNNNIAVQWTVENELNIKEYQIEKSADGRSFNKVNATAAKANNNSTVTYNWLDESALTGKNYYRIKTINNNGSYEYSKVVKVVFEKDASSITVYPNPVTEGKIGLRFTNTAAGTYQVKIVNSLGTEINKISVKHTGGNGLQTIVPSVQLSSGLYELQIIGPDKTNNALKLMVAGK